MHGWCNSVSGGFVRFNCTTNVSSYLISDCWVDIISCSYVLCNKLCNRDSIDSKAFIAIEDDISTFFYRFIVVSFVVQARSIKKLDEMRERTYVILPSPRWKELYNNSNYLTFIQLQVFKSFQAFKRQMSFLNKNIKERRRVQIVMSVKTSTSCYNHVFPWWLISFVLY